MCATQHKKLCMHKVLVVAACRATRFSYSCQTRTPISSGNRWTSRKTSLHHHPHVPQEISKWFLKLCAEISNTSPPVAKGISFLPCPTLEWLLDFLSTLFENLNHPLNAPKPKIPKQTEFAHKLTLKSQTAHKAPKPSCRSKQPKAEFPSAHRLWILVRPQTSGVLAAQGARGSARAPGGGRGGGVRILALAPRGRRWEVGIRPEADGGHRGQALWLRPESPSGARYASFGLATARITLWSFSLRGKAFN